MKKIKTKVVENMVFLYALTFSNYLFNFITVPYQTRIFDPATYGKIAFASAVITYFQLCFDFGFILSGTEQVATNREDRVFLGQMLTAVNASKLFLIAIGIFILIILNLTVNVFKEDMLLFLLFFLNAAFTTLLPDFLYRGLENMRVITYRSVAIRALFTVLIFVFLRDSSQYYLIPLFNLTGAVISVGIMYYDIYMNLNIKFEKVKFDFIKDVFIKSSFFFYSRIAGTVHSVTNMLILGVVYKNAPIVGLFSGADKLVVTAKSMFGPISDSLYPHMVKNKDFAIIKKTLLILMPILVLGCAVVGYLGPDLCAILFGENYRESGIILRFLLPGLVATLPNYILGFPVLSPMGLSKHANYSVIFGAFCQIVQICILLAFNIFNVYTLCIISSITEILILTYRTVIIFKNRNLLVNDI